MTGTPRPRGRVVRRIVFVLVGVIAAGSIALLQATDVAWAQEAGEAVGDEAAVTTEEVALDFSEYFPEWAQYQVIGTAVWQLLAAFLFILVGLILKRLSDHIFERKIIPLLEEKTAWEFDNLFAEAASKPFGYLLLLGGVAGALGVLPLPPEPNVRGFVYGGLKVLLAANTAWFLFRVTDMVVTYIEGFTERTESKLDDQLVPLLRKALKATIGIVLGVWVIQLLGYSVSSLIAGLGIGGLAIALGLQDTLANLFGSVFIFMDRPFAVGDWIKVGDVEGTVEDIGFRTTRIRTFPKTLVAIPNKTVANETIDNFTKMPKRRVKQTIGVTYETTPGQMERVVEAIQKILESDQGVHQEMVVVRFTDFGPSSLDLTVLYFTIDISFADHAATRQRVNLGIMRALESLGVSMAFPTSTIYLEGDVARELARGGVGAEGREHGEESRG